MAFLRKKYKIRKATAAGGHEITLPPAWMENKDIKEVELLYDPFVVVIVPLGIKVNEKVLEGAFEKK